MVGQIGEGSVGAGQAGISNFNDGLLCRLLHAGMFPLRLQAEIFQVRLKAVQQSLDSFTVVLRGHAYHSLTLPFSSEDTKLINMTSLQEYFKIK